MSSTETSTIVKTRFSVKKIFFNMLKRSDTSVVMATMVLFAIFAFSSDSFLSSYNIFNVSRTVALYFFVAIGQAFVLVIGGMNLSLGSIGGLAVITAGYGMDTMGWSPWIVVPMALLVGIAAGYVNGIIIVKLKLNSFVVTLATSFIFAGLVNGISKGYAYVKIPASFKFIGTEGLFGLPFLFWIMLLTLVVLGYMFKYTVIGRRILATGGNEVAARMSGIKTSKIIVIANVLSGFSAALAGVLWVSRLGSAPPATGSDWMIISFAVSVIGGTALAGGEITVIGLLASSIMIALIKNGLIMMNVNVYFEQTFLGIIILLAVMVESFRLKYNSAKRI